MSDPLEPPPNSRFAPILQLALSRLREFSREPEAVFWVYGFPILMVLALGIAFRTKPIERINVDVAEGPASAGVVDRLAGQEKFVVQHLPAEDCRVRLRTGKTALVVVPATDGSVTYLFDPTRAESLLARNALDDALQRAAKRVDAFATRDEEFTEPGGRYIDFLVPGLLGMNLMGGGLFGLGFVIVDMRIRKLLKRLLATPMRKSDFLLALMLSRLAFLVPEVATLLAFAYFAFGVTSHGSLLAVGLLCLIGAVAFSGVGLLMASRAKTMEAVSGLMNLAMLPQWTLSGVFFSYERFPETFWPVIRALPLTALIDALRAVMLEGAGLLTVAPQIAILGVWGVGSFVLALRWFRWQ